MPWNLLGILFCVCALLSSVGFYKFVYFLSIGYGFAIAGGSVAVFVMYMLSHSSTPLSVMVVLLAPFIIYGARLSGFLLKREIGNSSYKKTEVGKETLKKNSEKKMPFFVLVVIWLTVAVLYTIQLSPMLFRFLNNAEDIVLPLLGVCISLGGIILESLSDRQKAAQKKVRPDMVATKGLYRMVRCPNYFGEIIFWTGVYIGGISAYKSAGEWITSSLAYISIVYIMFNGAQRLEKRQMKRYGNNKEYKDYADKTPIIIPFLPIYHLNRK